MTSISVGLGLRLILLFVVSLHPGIKMVQYPQPISSLEVHPAVECHPIQGGKRGGGGAVTILLGASCHRKKVTL